MRNIAATVSFITSSLFFIINMLSLMLHHHLSLSLYLFHSLLLLLSHTTLAFSHSYLLIHNHQHSLSCPSQSPPTITLSLPGQKVEQVSGGVVDLHQQDLSVALKALIALEHTAQNNFLNMQSQFKISS
jgi:hypothetical protein